MVKIVATTCRTLRKVVSRAPSRRSSKISKSSSAGKVPVCKDGDHHRNTQVENPVENEVIKGREHQHRHCVSHVSERNVRLEFDNSQRHEREKEIQDSSMSEAELLNDTLQRATLTRAELMDDVEANPRVICVSAKEVDAATFTSVNGQKLVDLVKGRASAGAVH